MKARATTRVDVWRDTDPEDSDGYGDAVETGTDPLLTDIAFSLIEQTQRVPDATSGEIVNVTYVTGRCGHEHEVKVGDRIHDPAGADADVGDWYAVTQVSAPQSPIHRLDRRLDLRKV